MKTLRQVFAAAGYQFRLWHRNPRVYVTFILAFILCFLLSGKVASVTLCYGMTVQFLEPFIWTFGDSSSVFLSSLLLVFLFSDLPSASRATPFFLLRTGRRIWLWGQALYVALGTLLYLVFTLLATSFFCAEHAFSGNVWSHTAAMLGYSGAGKAISVPANIKTMETASPYRCALTIFSLMLCYALFLCMMILYMNLKKGTGAGAVAALVISLYGFLLNPDALQSIINLSEREYYIANVLTGWLSPLNHAVFSKHNFGFDHLPALWESYLLFVLLIAVLLFLSYREIGSYDFDFSGTQGEN